MSEKCLTSCDSHFEIPAYFVSPCFPSMNKEKTSSFCLVAKVSPCLFIKQRFARSRFLSTDVPSAMTQSVRQEHGTSRISSKSGRSMRCTAGSSQHRDCSCSLKTIRRACFSMDNLSSLCLLCLFARARPCTNVNGLSLQWGKKISSLEKFCRKAPID